MHEMKGKNIILEGPDNCGKSFLLKQTFGKDFNKNNFIQDRGMLTSLIYARALNRENISDLEEAFKKDMYSNRNLYFILDVSEQLLKSRFDAIGDDRHAFENILKINREYQKFYSDNAYANLIPLYDCENFIEELENHIDKFQLMNSNIFSDVFMAAQNASFNKDIMNYSFNWIIDVKDLEDGEIKRLYNKDISENLNKSKILDTNYYFVKNKERFERHKIMSDLLFNLHVQITKYGEGLGSRRFISISDSCFSFLQFIIHQNELYCTVHMRSSNAVNNIFVDVQFILEAIREFISFIKIYEFKDLSCILNKVHVDLNVSSLHYRI